MRELQLRPHYKVSVIAVHDAMLDQMIPVTDPDAPLKDSDTLLLAGTNESLARVSRIDWVRIDRVNVNPARASAFFGPGRESPWSNATPLV